MTDEIAELANARRARLWSTIQRLEDDELRSRVERSYKSSQPSIEEWHDFVEGVELVMLIVRIGGLIDSTGTDGAVTEKIAS